MLKTCEKVKRKTNSELNFLLHLVQNFLLSSCMDFCHHDSDLLRGRSCPGNGLDYHLDCHAPLRFARNDGMRKPVIANEVWRSISNKIGLLRLPLAMTVQRR